MANDGVSERIKIIVGVLLNWKQKNVYDQLQSTKRKMETNFVFPFQLPLRGKSSFSSEEGQASSYVIRFGASLFLLFATRALADRSVRPRTVRVSVALVLTLL